MYLVDSEGLFDTNKEQVIDQKLVSMVILLSSYLIFNDKGVIDGATINQLALTL